MADPTPEDTSVKPLDPAIVRVQARMRALMLIAGLTLGIGLLAVFAAIIYLVATPSDKGRAETAAAGTPAASAGAARVRQAVEATKAVLPVRAWLVSTAVSGERIVLAYEHSGGTTMFVVDATSLEITGRLDLKPE